MITAKNRLGGHEARRTFRNNQSAVGMKKSAYWPLIAGLSLSILTLGRQGTLNHIFSLLGILGFSLMLFGVLLFNKSKKRNSGQQNHR